MKILLNMLLFSYLMAPFSHASKKCTDSVQKLIPPPAEFSARLSKGKIEVSIMFPTTNKVLSAENKVSVTIDKSQGIQEPVEIPLDSFKDSLRDPSKTKQKLRITQKLTPKAPKMSAAPNYAAMNSDGYFSGLIFPDLAMGTQHSREVMKEYLEFYEELGFRFKKTNNVDLASYLEQELRQGRLDYLIREADGVDEFRFASKGSLYIGEKPGSSSKTTVQKVAIYMPLGESDSEGKYLPWSQIGEHLKNAGESPDTVPNDLLYFDTKCFSAGRACSIFRQVNNKRFIPIGAKSDTLAFSNAKDNSFRALMRSFLEQKTYAEMRRKTNTKTSSPAVDNYVLPDDPEYRSLFLNTTERELSLELLQGDVVIQKQNLYF